MWKAGFSDSNGYNIDGLIEKKLLFTHPGEYLLNIFHSNYGNSYTGLGSSVNSYWNDLSSNLMSKFLSVCDIFSFGNFYINEIFYNYVIFFGAIGLYRVFNNIYKDKSTSLIICCFLLPSLLLYTSIIHKDGFIFSALGIIIFNINISMIKGNFLSKRFLYILFMLILIFTLRSYVFLALLPAIFAWVLSYYIKKFSVLIFIVTYSLAATVFFTIGFVIPKFNLMDIVKDKQTSFEKLGHATTRITIDSLNTNFKSFAKNAPISLTNSILRPYLWDTKLTIYLLPFAIELIFYQLLVLLFIFYRNKIFVYDPVLLFGLFFSISLLLTIGFIVPFIGAIIRYRSIYIPFILTPIICNIDWKKIGIIKHILK